MDTKTPIQAEIKAGKLIIEDKYEADIEGIKNIIQTFDPESIVNGINDLFYSFAKIGSLLAHIDSKDAEELAFAVPNTDAIFMLKVLQDSFKIM